MLKIRDFAFDFDLSAPEDLERYLRSSAAMQEKERQAPPAPADPADPQYLADYTAWLKCYCGLLTDWIDDVLGAGACNRLLGPKTSLAGLLDVYDEIAAAAAAQGSAIGRHLAQYTPNRAAGKTARAAGKTAQTAGKTAQTAGKTARGAGKTVQAAEKTARTAESTAQTAESAAQAAGK